MKALRRSLLLALCVLLGVTAAYAQEDTLTVFDWAGYDLEGFWAPFAEANPDVTVEFTYITEDSEAFARMASGLETDVLHPCWHQPYIDSSLVQGLDTSRLSNWESIPAVLTTKGQGADGTQYFVPHVWGYSSMIVRTDLVEEVPDSWADLWDPQYAGHIGIYDSGEVALAIAATVLGLEDPFNPTEEEQAMIEAKLIELKPQLLAFLVDPAEMEQLLISGDMWIMAGGWNSTYMAVARALAETNPDAQVEYVAPVEGRFGWLCGYGISADTDNLDMAYAYLDALISPESQAYLTNTFGFGGANPESLSMVDPETVELLQLDQTDILNDTIFLPDVSDELREAYVTIWDNVKLAP